MDSHAHRHDDAGPTLSRRYALFVVAHRRIILVLAAVITLLSASQLHRLDITNDPDSGVLPRDNRHIATINYVKERFDQGNMLVVGLEVRQGDIYQPWFLAIVREIHAKLAALPTAQPATFLSLVGDTVKYMGSGEEGLYVKPLLPREGLADDDPETTAAQIAVLREGAESNPILGPVLLSMQDASGKRCAWEKKEACSAKATFIIGHFSDGVRKVYAPWLAGVESILEPYRHDQRIRVLVSGEPYLLARMTDEMARKWWLFAISIAIVLVILYLEYGFFIRRAIFSLVGVAVTIIFTLGLMGVTQFPLTTMMILTPMLLLAIGIGHAVQITRRYLHELALGKDPESSGVDAIERTMVPAALSIITDMAGFATLILVDISFYKAYAIFGVIGMFTLLLSCTTMIPLMLITFSSALGREPTSASAARGWERHLGRRVTGIIIGPMKWGVVGVAFLILLISGHYAGIGEGSAKDPMPGIEKGINYASAAFKASSEPGQTIQRFNEIMPGVITFTIPVRGVAKLKPSCDDVDDLDPPQCHDPDEEDPQGVFNASEVLAAIDTLEQELRAHPDITFTISYAQYVKMVNLLLAVEPGERLDHRNYAIPTRASLQAEDPDDDRDPDAIVQLYNSLLDTMVSQETLGAFLDTETWHEGVILGFVNTMDPRRTHAVVTHIQDLLERHGNDPGFKALAFGLTPDEIAGHPSVEDRRPGVGGFLGSTEATRDVCISEWLKSPLLTAAAIFVIATLMFRSGVISMLVVWVLGFALFAQYGMAGYFTSVENWSGNLHFANLVTLSISLGLGVDYSIYMLARLREEMAVQGASWRAALERTLSTTGTAVLVSVVVLLGSLIPLVATDLGNTWGLAVYIGVAIVIDLFAALTFLPLMVGWLRPGFVFGKGRRRS
ncbi:MAG: MMPL family transporter [Magnetococcales bacterium]|nr:MMPL family transporter [Magnetococcales bacterium]